MLSRTVGVRPRDSDLGGCSYGAHLAPLLLIVLPDPELAAHIEDVHSGCRAIEKANERLSRVEQVKRHAVVSEPWLPGGDELTPTMKLKRRAIAEKYSDLIENLYSGVLTT